jgi:hypothetical protein
MLVKRVGVYHAHHFLASAGCAFDTSVSINALALDARDL